MPILFRNQAARPSRTDLSGKCGRNYLPTRFRIENVVDPNICIIVGHVKIPIVPKFAAPAVGADKRAIPSGGWLKLSLE